ncbi:MAG: peptide deformylase [Deltaproteobacteria bacterium]|nr:peptide deformylase [Deltaproteobacteria bacterium]
MAILEILQYPNPILKKKTQPIERIDQTIRELAQDMAETMYAVPGVGLAAPQVGRPIRLAVLDVTPADQPKNLVVLVNPVVVETEGECSWEEGCLSVPEYAEEVKRKKRVIVRCQNLAGENVEIVGEELLSIVLQHEIDHLDGILFLDRLSKLKRDLFKKRLQKEKKEGMKL